jgi:hypothetical protein
MNLKVRVLTCGSGEAVGKHDNGRGRGEKGTRKIRRRRRMRKKGNE